MMSKQQPGGGGLQVGWVVEWYFPRKVRGLGDVCAGGDSKGPASLRQVWVSPPGQGSSRARSLAEELSVCA